MQERYHAWFHYFMHERNIICSQTQLDDIVHEQTIICRQLFAGHVVGSRPMKRKKNLLQMIILFNVPLGDKRFINAAFGALEGLWESRSKLGLVRTKLLSYTTCIHQAPVVQKVDSTIHRINLYPVDNAIGFPNTYPLDSDLSNGQCYPTFEQPGPDLYLATAPSVQCL